MSEALQALSGLISLIRSDQQEKNKNIRARDAMEFNRENMYIESGLRGLEQERARVIALEDQAIQAGLTIDSLDTLDGADTTRNAKNIAIKNLDDINSEIINSNRRGDKIQKSLAEFNKGTQLFDHVDINKDGILSISELQTPGGPDYNYNDPFIQGLLSKEYGARESKDLRKAVLEGDLTQIQIDSLPQELQQKYDRGVIDINVAQAIYDNLETKQKLENNSKVLSNEAQRLQNVHQGIINNYLPFEKEDEKTARNYALAISANEVERIDTQNKMLDEAYEQAKLETSMRRMEHNNEQDRYDDEDWALDKAKQEKTIESSDRLKASLNMSQKIIGMKVLSKVAFKDGTDIMPLVTLMSEYELLATGVDNNFDSKFDIYIRNNPTYDRIADDIKDLITTQSMGSSEELIADYRFSSDVISDIMKKGDKLQAFINVNQQDINTWIDEQKGLSRVKKKWSKVDGRIAYIKAHADEIDGANDLLDAEAWIETGVYNNKILLKELGTVGTQIKAHEKVHSTYLSTVLNSDLLLGSKQISDDEFKRALEILNK